MNITSALKLRFLTLAIGGVAFAVVSCGGPSEEQHAEDAEQQLPDDQELQQEDRADQQDPQIQPGQPQDMDTDVSQEELQAFAEAMEEIQYLHTDVQAEMSDIIQEEGLDMERYNEIMGQQQGFGGEGEMQEEPTEEEMQQFDEASDRITVLQEGLEEDAINILEDHGLSFERYQEINMALEQDPELQQEFMQYFDGGQQQQQQAPR